MDDELEIPAEFEQVLQPGMINVSQQLGCTLPLPIAVARINHFFEQRDLGYRKVSGDTFKLRVRPRRFPVFGMFVGYIHVYEKLGHQTGHRHVYEIEGLLQYRVSLLWFLSVCSLFFLISILLNTGLWQGAFFIALGAGSVIFWTYMLGRRERDDVDERLHAAMLELRATIQNIR